MSSAVKDLAGELLDLEVDFPVDEPSNPELDIAEEGSWRLGDLLEARLPSVLFDEEGSTYRAKEEWYGAESGKIVQRYEKLRQVIQVAARTGWAGAGDIAECRSTVDLLADVMKAQAARKRVGFGKDWLGEARRKGLIQSDNSSDLLNSMAELQQSNSYECYMMFKCSEKILGSIRDALDEMGRSLSKTGLPPLP